MDLQVGVDSGNRDYNRSGGYRHVCRLRGFDKNPNIATFFASPLPRTVCCIGSFCCGVALITLGYGMLLYSFSRRGSWQDAMIGLSLIGFSLFFFHWDFRLLHNVLQKGNRDGRDRPHSPSKQVGSGQRPNLNILEPRFRRVVLQADRTFGHDGRFRRRIFR
jgi:hypothetical protein